MKPAHRLRFPTIAAWMLSVVTVASSLAANDSTPFWVTDATLPATAQSPQAPAQPQTAQLQAGQPQVRLTRPPAPDAAPPRFNSDLYKIDKQIIDGTETVGENVRYRLRMEALADIEQVRLLEALPAGLDFVESTPAPTESKGGSYLWDWPGMTRGSTKEVTITVRPSADGWFVPTTKVAVIPTIALPLFAGRPQLEIKKAGPSQAELGDTISFHLAVTNIGNAPARNVVVTDTLPAGLYGTEPGTSRNVVTHQIGTLAAGETRNIDVPVKAAVIGEWDNRANAFSTQQVQANAVAHISIIESKLAINKTGPDKAFVFGMAAYSVALTNEGAHTIENIQLTDEIPGGTRLVSASDGGTVADSIVTWTIPRLAPGETARREVTLTGQKQTTVTAAATARFSSNRTVQASATTLWEGAPGVLTEVVDDADPVKVGATVTYSIKITNQSPMRELTSNAVFELAPNMRFKEITKGIKAGVSGQKITVENMRLKPKGTLSFKIIVKAEEPGLGGIRFEYGSNVLPRPVVKEELTYVY